VAVWQVSPKSQRQWQNNLVPWELYSDEDEARYARDCEACLKFDRGQVSVVGQQAKKKPS